MKTLMQENQRDRAGKQPQLNERVITGEEDVVVIGHERWHAHHHTAGTGHLYQGRFKCFPVEADDHLYTVLRYVERNALRANLVKRAEDWRWSSLWRRSCKDLAQRAILTDWPVAETADWVRRVNQAQTEAELTALRGAVMRGRPFGSDLWARRTAKRLGLEYTLRPRGRPRKNGRPLGPATGAQR